MRDFTGEIASLDANAQLQSVSATAFYQIIKDRKLDVHPHIAPTKSPYTSIFKFRDGVEFGRSVPTGNYPAKERYYIVKP